MGIVSGLVDMSSVSRAGLSDVIMEFAWGTDMDFAAIDVREQLAQLGLPGGAEDPILLRFDPALDPIMRISVGSATPGDVPLADQAGLRLLADQSIKQRLESIDGVAAAIVAGGVEEEIQINVDQSRAALLGILLSQIASRLQRENVDVTGGSIADGAAEYVVRVLARFTDLDEIGRIVVGEVGDVQVRLQDLAEVRSGYREQSTITRTNRRPSVEIAIHKEAAANTVAVAAAVKDAPRRGGGGTGGRGRRGIARGVRPVALHRAVDPRRDPGRRVRRPVGDRRAVPVPAPAAQYPGGGVGDSDFGGRQLLSHVPGRRVPQHHVARRAGARHRHAGGQLHRGAGEHRPPPGRRRRSRHRGPYRRRRGGQCGGRRDPDHLVRVHPGGVRERHRRAAVRGSGAHRHLFTVGQPGGGADADPDGQRGRVPDGSARGAALRPAVWYRWGCRDAAASRGRRGGRPRVVVGTGGSGAGARDPGAHPRRRDRAAHAHLAAGMAVRQLLPRRERGLPAGAGVGAAPSPAGHPPRRCPAGRLREPGVVARHRVDPRDPPGHPGRRRGVAARHAGGAYRCHPGRDAAPSSRTAGGGADLRGGRLIAHRRCRSAREQRPDPDRSAPGVPAQRRRSRPGSAPRCVGGRSRRDGHVQPSAAAHVRCRRGGTHRRCRARASGARGAGGRRAPGGRSPGWPTSAPVSPAPVRKW